MLLIALVPTKAQVVQADISKSIGTTFAKKGTTVPGIVNHPTSVDLNWKPVLTKKFVEIEHDAPNQKLIDSIKAEKLKQKKEYELNNPIHGSATRSVTPIIGNNFSGNANSGMVPLDNNIAISDNGVIVSVTNEVIAYYDVNGNNTYYKDIPSFLPKSYGVTDVCDPVVIYDSGHDRFIFECQQTPLASNNYIFVCFSIDNNPLDGWTCYEIQSDPTNSGAAFDYPKIGITDTFLYITGNLFYEPSNTNDQSIIFEFKTADGYSASNLNWDYYSSISGSPFTILPVSWGQAGNTSTDMLFVSTSSAGGSAINLYQIQGQSLHNWSVATDTYSPAGDASQLGTSCLLNTGDCRSLSGFYLNGIIHFVFHSDYSNGYCGINYNRLDVTGLTNTSILGGDVGYDFTYPAVASYAQVITDKSVMIGMGISGSSIYPQIAVINCDGGGNWSNYSVVYNSDSYAACTNGSSQRWGDYSGMSRKHNSSSPVVWMSGMYADASNVWQTWIAQIGVQKTNTGISDIENELNSKVYPNPIANTFNVEFPLNESCNLNIAIVDSYGRTVKALYNGNGTTGDNVFSFDKSNLSSGIYFLTIKSSNQTIKTEKIIVN